MQPQLNKHDWKNCDQCTNGEHCEDWFQEEQAYWYPIYLKEKQKD